MRASLFPGRVTCVAVVASLAAGCSLPWQQLQLPGPIEPSATTGALATTNRKPGVPLAKPADHGADEARVFKGTGELTGTPKSRDLAPGDGGAVKDGVQINLVQASVAEAAKTILGDMLGANYVISDKIKFNVTIQTAKPVSRDALLSIFEAVLAADGAALVNEGGLYKIVPSAEAQAAGGPIRAAGTGRGQLGYATQVLPLKHVAAPEMERILRSVAPQARILRTDPSRNLIVVAGTRTDLANIADVVSVFDVDHMRGMSFGFFPVESSDPEAIAQELDTIFANDSDGPGKGVVRFVPNKRLKSILVISARPAYIDKAEKWLKRIDLAGRASEKQVHVYHVQNRPAVELAQLLQKVYVAQEQPQASRGTTQPTAPRDTPVTVAGASTGATVANPAGSPPFFAPVPLAPPPQIVVQTPGSAETSSGPPSAAAGGPVPQGDAAGGRSASSAPLDDRASGISVVPDEPNNALIVTATASEYKRVRQILARIDAAQCQVMLEATIAEVTLNDQLRFGLRWFFEKGASELLLTDIASTVVAPAVPGFSYFVNTPNVKVALNALSNVTDVNVVSSPTLMTLDNKKAILQVGNEVPVATQSAISVVTPGAPIVNSISYRNTGVILNITPRVSDSGRVLLEIEQEVSDVVATDSSTIDSPTFQQRRVRTTVAVQDGEAIVLAGMMQDRASRGRTQVPLVGDIPLVGNLFKNKNDTIGRTELLIAITPRVVKDPAQIRGIAAEFRDKLNFSTRPQRRAPPDHREQADRLAR